MARLSGRALLPWWSFQLRRARCTQARLSDNLGAHVEVDVALVFLSVYAAGKRGNLRRCGRGGAVPTGLAALAAESSRAACEKFAERSA